MALQIPKTDRAAAYAAVAALNEKRVATGELPFYIEAVEATYTNADLTTSGTSQTDDHGDALSAADIVLGYEYELADAFDSPGAGSLDVKLGFASGVAGAEATAVNQATVVKCPVFAWFQNPIAKEVISIVANVAMANGAQIIAAQPDYPRTLQVDITDGDSSVSAGTLDIVGVGAGGEALSESVDLTGGTAVKDTTYAYATVTSATIAGLVGATGADLIGVGVGDGLGLPVPDGGSNLSIAKTVVDDADETVAGVDTTANAVTPTTVPNATHDYMFFGTYDYSHNHTQNAHSHSDTVGAMCAAFDAYTASANEGIGPCMGSPGPRVVGAPPANQLKVTWTSTTDDLDTFTNGELTIRAFVAKPVVHYDAQAVIATGDVWSPDQTALAVTVSDAAVTLATVLSLIENAGGLRDIWTRHIANTTAHKAADTTNALTSATATDQATANTFLNELQGDINAHMIDTTYHVRGDANQDGTTIASDLASSITLGNALKAVINAHILRAAPGTSIDLVAA